MSTLDITNPTQGTLQIPWMYKDRQILVIITMFIKDRRTDPHSLSKISNIKNHAEKMNTICQNIFAENKQAMIHKVFPQ